MKKGIVMGLLALVVAAAVWAAFWGGEKEECAGSSAYLRMHIRADSNAPEAQAVKYAVRDRVVQLLTPVVAECGSKAEAMQAVQKSLPDVEAAAAEVLHSSGFSYGARASLRQENFPTRVYEQVTLAAGVYDALILELGSGKGDNWWCVVYPPLCFSGTAGNIVYKSKLADLVRKFFASE